MFRRSIEGGDVDAEVIMAEAAMHGFIYLWRIWDDLFRFVVFGRPYVSVGMFFLTMICMGKIIKFIRE